MMTENDVSQDYLNMSDEELDNVNIPTLEDNDNSNDESLPISEEELTEESNQINDDTHSDSYDEQYLIELGKKVLAPFKADGKEIQVRTPEEIISLMQKGVNYNRKSQELNKQKEFYRLLEKNNLLDTERLSYLIDLNEKKPEAIAKLIQDSNIDLYDFDVEQAKQYIPTNRKISPKEIELENILESINSSPNFSKTVKVLGEQWDEQSRNKVIENPHLIAVINEHMDTGIYDTVINEVERQRSLGNLNGLSDLDAYDAVGNILYKQHKEEIEEVNSPNPTEEELKRNKVVASSNQKKVANKTSLTPQDILSLSDEEFMKINFR